MDWKPDSIRAVSRYVFDYIVGILWIISGLAWAASTRVLHTTDSLFSQIAPVSKLPELVLGFLLAIAGVVLPYCVSVVLKPATLKLMGALQKLDRRLRRWRWSKKEQQGLNEDDGPSLDKLAVDRVIRELKCRRSDIDRQVRVTFVQVRNPSAATYTAAIEEEVFFRATTVPASAVLVGGIVYRLPIALHIALSIVAMIALLGFGSWLSNRVFNDWVKILNTAIVLTPEAASTNDLAGPDQDPSVEFPVA